VTDDNDRLLEVAKRYGVNVFLSILYDGEETRGLKRKPLTKGTTAGPVDHWCNPKKKSIWLENFSSDIEYAFHELCHVIINPPGGIDQLSEDVALMPFERTLARQCLSPAGFKRVLAWQETGTQIEWWCARKKKYYPELGMVPNYSRWGLWRESFRNLRRMGVIDKRGKVTWQWPNWKRATKALMSRGNLIGP